MRVRVSGPVAVSGLIALSMLCMRAPAQTSPLPPQIPGAPEAARPFPGDEVPGISPELRHQTEIAQRDARERDISKATSRILQLAGQVQRDVRDHGALSDEDRHLLEEIVKLARGVKGREKD